jgi:exodeoxyribonuclease-1
LGLIDNIHAEHIDDSHQHDIVDAVAYDNETSDTNPRHGQIFQFAAIHTDASLQPKSETEVLVRRLPYVVPAVGALDTTGFDPVELDNVRRPSEYEAAAQIEAALKPKHYGERLYIGYNQIRFDDEFIRSMLFRNLRRPWVTSGKHAIRVDAFHLARLAASGFPGSVKVAINPETGKQDWRLKSVCEANGIPTNAHDALGDARSTLALASLIQEAAPGVWKAVLQCGNSRRMSTMLATSARDRVPLRLFSHGDTPKSVPFLPLGTDGKGHWLVADLSFDPAKIPTHIDPTARLRTGTNSPFRVLKISASPLVIPDYIGDYITHVPHDLMVSRLREWNVRADIAANAVEAYSAHSWEHAHTPTSEETIYDRFSTPADESAMNRFHACENWIERAAVHFHDTRLSDFAARLILVNATPMELEAIGAKAVHALQERCSEALHRPFDSAEARWTTIAGEEKEAAESWKIWSQQAYDRPVQGDLFGF